MVEKIISLTADTQDIEKEESSQTQHAREHHITSCLQRIESIAQTHGIDSKLHIVEHKSLPERLTFRQQKQLECQQANLEQIVQLSHSFCDDKTAGSPEPDWLYRFFELAKDIHGEGMQNLWARILKQEIIKPGSTSLKALSILKTMTHREAQTLQRACGLTCSFGNDKSNKLITGFRQPEKGFKRYFKPDITEQLPLGQYKLSFTDLLLLMDLGLILRTDLESGPLQINQPLSLRGQNNTLQLIAYTNGTRLCYYRFSPTGNELAKLVGKKSYPEYFDSLIALLSRAFEIKTEMPCSVNIKI